MDSLKKYANELGEILKTFDVDKLNDFIERNKNFYGKDFYDRWTTASLKAKEMTLCKMILARTDLSSELKLKAEERLLELKGVKQ